MNEKIWRKEEEDGEKEEEEAECELEIEFLQEQQSKLKFVPASRGKSAEKDEEQNKNPTDNKFIRKIVSKSIPVDLSVVKWENRTKNAGRAKCSFFFV